MNTNYNEMSKNELLQTVLNKDNIINVLQANTKFEVAALVGQISKRLKSDFCKFDEIKKTNDIEYFDFLILILDEVRKTLKSFNIIV